jgi:UDP-N-acetylglucosamine 1-carboxyvinyltransferase
MGANIEVRGQESIIVHGVKTLSGIKYKVMPDNIEALTYLIGGAITNGNIEIIDFPTKHLEVPLIFLRESGARFYLGDNSLIVKGSNCYPLELSTGPYPGINSDMQPLLTAFALCAEGVSKIIDLRFPDRFDYLDELGKMGAKYKIENNIAVIEGSKLKGNNVKAVDLRGGAAMILAGLVAEGETIIENFEQVLRGYENVIEKIQQLGGNIKVA